MSRIAGIAFLFPLWALSAPWAARARAGSPPARRILSSLRKDHPRLLVEPGRFASLKREIPSDPLLRKWYGRLLEEGKKVLRASPSTYKIPDGLRLLATSRRVLSRVTLLAFLFHMEGGDLAKAFLDRAWKELEAAARFPDWNPRHFLDTAEMTAAFAVGYDWLYDSWTGKQREILEKAILEKGLKPALQAYRGKARFGWWIKSSHNWNQVCNGGIGMGALAVANKASKTAGEILAGALKSLPRALARLAPDGAWDEGPGYWGYANKYTALFLSSLRTALETDFGLSKVRGMDVTGLFPIYITGPTGRTFNFADGGDHPIYGPVFFWLARRFGNPVYAWHEKENPRPDPFDLLWYLKKSESPARAGLPLDKWFRKVQVVTFRSSWKGKDALFLAAKGGNNQANHGHLDLGTFVLDAGGLRWALDLGSDNYNLPGYWSRGAKGRRWNYYRMRAEGHNTLVMNPGKGPDQYPLARAEVVKFQTGPDLGKAVIDLSRAYKGNAARAVRGFLFVRKPGGVLVQDEVKPLEGKRLDLWWFLHTRAGVKVGGGGRRALLSRKGRALEALLLSPAGSRFQVVPAGPFPHSPDPKNQRKNKGVRKLAVLVRAEGEVRVAVFLRLLRAGEPCMDPPDLTPLASW